MRHPQVLAQVARRVNDAQVLHVLKLLLKASGKKGVAQGGVLSPVRSNLYLNEVDQMLERAKEVTQQGQYPYVEYARFADDRVILVDAYARPDWLLTALQQRLSEEVAKIQVEMNTEKSRLVDLSKGESFGFLGFDFRWVQSLQGKWRPASTPKLRQRTALLRKLKDLFRRFQSPPVERVIEVITPILRGWVQYFALGHASRCFGFIKDWVEKQVRRHLRRARKLRGCGWTRWRSRGLYDTVGLFHQYQVRGAGRAAQALSADTVS